MTNLDSMKPLDIWSEEEKVMWTRMWGVPRKDFERAMAKIFSEGTCPDDVGLGALLKEAKR